MEALEYNIWDIQRISQNLDDDLPITNELLKSNEFSKGGSEDRLTIYKHNRDYRCDILWKNIDLKTIGDLKNLYKKLFKRC